MTGIIYKVTSPSGLSYIGQTNKHFELRWREHKYDALDPKKDHCRVLNNAIRKYGIEAFTHEVLCTCSVEELNHYEEFYIVQHNTMVPNGYNLKSGGSVSYHSTETKDRIRDALKGKTFTTDEILRRSQTRKKSNLPMFLCERRESSRVVGYRVKVPGMAEKCFQSKKVSLEENYNKAYKFLNESLSVCKDYAQRLVSDGATKSP